MDSILIKTLAAVILGFVISAVLGNIWCPPLRRWKAGQAIKEDGPTWHMSKQGTPTMGVDVYCGGGHCGVGAQRTGHSVGGSASVFVSCLPWSLA
ncbi:MAG: hypothetical protein ACLS43_08640 [Evtepia gabavorous]